jgi:hypothetical protein
LDLAKETGWSEKFILEELPITRGWQYRHAILRSHGVQTFFIADESDIQSNRELFDSLAFDDTPILE